MIEIRQVTEAEHDEADQIWLEIFQAGTFSQLVPLRAGREAYKHRITRFGLWDEAGMQAGFQMYDNQMHYGSDVVLSTAYISSVAVRAAARGKGYGYAVLRHMLEHMRDAGQVFVTLVPFSYDYYRRLGWDWMATTRTYRAATRILPAAPADESARAATRADFSGIQAMYARFAKNYRGMSVRDHADWTSVLDDTSEQRTYSFVYEREAGIEGYLAFSGGSGQDVSLTEFLTLTPQAQGALLNLLQGMHMQTKFIVWEAPEDDGLWSQVMSRDIETKLHPAAIGRVVDVSSALGALRPDATLASSITIQVHDPGVSWNDRTWQITAENGVVHAKPSQQEPEIRTDIRALSQAYMGALSLAALRKQNRIEVLSEPAFKILRHLLDGPPMWGIGPI